MKAACSAVQYVDTFGRNDRGTRRTFTRVVIDAGDRMPESLEPGGARPDDALGRLLDQTSRRRITDLVDARVSRQS